MRALAFLDLSGRFADAEARAHVAQRQRELRQDRDDDEHLITLLANGLRELDDMAEHLQRHAEPDRDAWPARVAELRDRTFALMEQVNPDQAWFWTREWQAKERQVDTNITAGNLITYETDQAFLAALDALDTESA